MDALMPLNLIKMRDTLCLLVSQVVHCENIACDEMGSLLGYQYLLEETASAVCIWSFK